MVIDRDTEELVREAEYNVNLVWQRWRAKFETKASKEILAMVAYQFAKLYYQLYRDVESQTDMLDGFEAELDRLLDLTDDDAVNAEIKEQADK